MNSATTNQVRMAKGDESVWFRVTKHADGRVSAEMSKSIVWRPIGGLQAARNRMAKLEAEGFAVVAAA